MQDEMRTDLETDAAENEDPLALAYIKLHQFALEMFVKHDIGKTAMRVYLFLCFNSLVAQGVSHKTPYAAIANYLGLSVRVVYRAISDLKDAGLITVRHHGDLVCDLPLVRLANVEAHQRGKEAREKADAKAFDKEVAKYEAVLNRNLTSNERDRLRMILNKRKAEEHS